MAPREPFDVEKAQAAREDIAGVIRDLDVMIEEFPEHGQYLTFARNHLKEAFMNLGYGIALTKGLDPLANKVEKK